MAKPQGKLVRIRASRLQKEDECIFCLPLAFRDVLLDLAERLEWGATWIDDAGDRVELSDAEKQIIELGIARLTMACEIVVNNNITIPEQQPGNINVNCGDSSTNWITPPPQVVRPDGTIVQTVCLPVDPENPSGEYDPILPDEGTLTPPPGWVDWQSFIDEKCRAANYMVDALLGVISAIDEAENRTSIIVNIVETIIQFLPIPAGKTSAWNKILKWVDKMLDFIDDVEEVWDWAQTIGAELESRRNEVVCLIYTTNDTVVAAAAIAQATLPGLVASMVSAGLGQATQTAVTEFWETILNDIVPRAYDFEWVLSIPESYQAPYNCSACGGGDLGNGWLLIPLEWDGTFLTSASPGVTNQDLVSLGAYLRMSGTADDGLDDGNVSPRFVAPGTAGLKPFGWHLDVQNLVNVNKFGCINLTEAPAISLGQDTSFSTSPMWCVRTSSASFETDTGITTNVPDLVAPGSFNGTNVLDGTETFHLGVHMECVQPGTFSQDIKAFLICRAD